MNLTNYLKELFISFIDTYKKEFSRSIGLVLLYTIVCFIFVAILLRFSNFDPISHTKQTSLLSYFIHDYSQGKTYSIVDLTEIIFLFFVSLFSISILRKNNKDLKEIKIMESFKYIKLNDIYSLVSILIICFIIDFSFFQIVCLIVPDSFNEIYQWFYNIIMYILRRFIPILLFSIVIYNNISNNKIKFNLRNIWFLFIAYIMINTISFELSMYIRIYVINLILIPIDVEKIFVYESILGIGLISLNFIGYHAIMINSVKLLENIELFN